ncbi:helix-turn-helix transcriptional regulator [Fimbriimonas ginsengisoli]|uniref:Helix-turn-helix, type 11 domain protein n=1 Tax=Fimbriimonas ginsengisoli Gsoil 348 TaxID=661478 RepID=A0A068NKE4_FIMGI|nr:WYL domain-containing protein [Fimbriimonas ginsengisoli]AIE84033.1 Helix-turn-helix, type 11 domain protein [Fimbriimonas ginsengisoli Gsoil 348]
MVRYPPAGWGDRLLTRVERLTALLVLLHDRKRTAETLSDELGVARRTVLRDVQSLTAMGVPVIALSGPNGGYEIPRDATLAPLHLTWREALLLTLAVEGLAKMSDTPFRADRASLVAKLRSIMPESQRDRVAAILDRVELEVPARPQRTPLLEPLLQLAGGWAEIEYDGERRVVRIDRLFADRGLWYVDTIGNGKSRRFRADRITAAVPCPPPERIEEPLPYDDPSHPLVRVRLSPKGVRRAQSDPNLGPHLPENGELAFRCPPDELEWYARYFAGFGEDALVEAPRELIQRILENAKRIESQYAFEGSELAPRASGS